MVPQPPKVFLTAEAAEIAAWFMLSKPVDGPAPLAKSIRGRLGGAVRLRTFLVRGRDYKARLADQDRYDDVVRKLRLTALSQYVLVVEAHDYDLRAVSDRYVIAEFVYDATSYDLDPRPLCVSYPEFTYVDPPDRAPRPPEYVGRGYANTGAQTAWRSQLYRDGDGRPAALGRDRSGDVVGEVK